MQPATGNTHWLIPDCYWPSISSPGAYPSHESICVLNTGKEDALLQLTFYFQDRDPISATSQCGAQRTHHVRLDALQDENGAALIPRDVPYAAQVICNVPIIVQYSRCDSSHPAVTLMTTMAHPVLP